MEKKYVDMDTYKQNLQTQCKELIRWNADRMQEIAGLQNVVDRNFNELKQWNADRMQEIRALQNFEVDESYIKSEVFIPHYGGIVKDFIYQSLPLLVLASLTQIPVTLQLEIIHFPDRV